VNVLKRHLQITVKTLLNQGHSQREIERLTGVDRKTIRRCAREEGGGDQVTEAGEAANYSGVATGSKGPVVGRKH
jgi:hypothetical protein